MTLLADDINAASGPTGKARRWTDEEKALLALILLGDVSAAVWMWDTLAPLPYRGLLESVPIDDVRERLRERLPPIWFDAYSQRYGLGNRGYIRESALIAVLESIRRAAQVRAEADIEAVYAGGDVGEWQQDTAAELKTLAVAMMLFGGGGTGRFSLDISAAASRALEFPLARLQRFARQIERGVVMAAEAVRRAVMYPDTVVTNIYHESRRIAHRAVGYAFEMNVLDAAADHCMTDPRRPSVPNCPELTERGWVDIGTLPSIGSRACLWNCRCRFSFARTHP